MKKKVRKGQIISRVSGHRKKKVPNRVEFDLMGRKSRKYYHVIAAVGEHFDPDDIVGLLDTLRKWNHVKVVGPMKKEGDARVIRATEVVFLAKGAAPDPNNQTKPEPAAPLEGEEYEAFKEEFFDKYRRR